MDAETVAKLRASNQVQDDFVQGQGGGGTQDFVSDSPQANSASADPTMGGEDPGVPPGSSGGSGPSDGQFYNGEPTAEGGAGTGFGEANFGGTDPVQSGTDPNAPPPTTGGGAEITQTGSGGGGSWSGGGDGGFAGSPGPIPNDSYIPDFQQVHDQSPQATEWHVTDEQTVQGQMASLMENDNPVFKSIREQIMRAHAAQGGKNSLMAARSATMAMANMAFQIGSQDAAVFAKSAEFNAAMSNQFGLAEQQFMHNALLSNQNFQQGKRILDMQIAGQLKQLGFQAQMQDRQFAFNLQMEGLQHQHQLETMDRAHGFDLENSELDYQHRWQLSEQEQAHALEQGDRNTENAMRAEMQQFGHQTVLQYMSEMGANTRQLMDAIGQVRSNDKINATQAGAATADLIRQFNAANDMMRSFFGNPLPGSPQSQTGGAGGGGGASGSAGGGSGTYNSPSYDYLSYNNSGGSMDFGPMRGYSLGQGGYQTYAPTVARFWGGSGRQSQPMYGSNTAYASGTAPRNPVPRATTAGGAQGPVGPGAGGIPEGSSGGHGGGGGGSPGGPNTGNGTGSLPTPGGGFGDVPSVPLPQVPP